MTEGCLDADHGLHAPSTISAFIATAIDP